MHLRTVNCEYAVMTGSERINTPKSVCNVEKLIQGNYDRVLCENEMTPTLSTSRKLTLSVNFS